MAANPWGKFKEDVLKALGEALTQLGWKPTKELDLTLKDPPDPSLGDLATTICFELAKELHKSPMWLEAADRCGGECRCRRCQVSNIFGGQNSSESSSESRIHEKSERERVGA